jgi:hypothetical protein
MLRPFLEPLSGPHVCDEVKVVVQIRMDTTQAIKECTLPTVFAFPTSLQFLALDTLFDLTMGLPTALPARDRTAKLLNLTQD